MQFLNETMQAVVVLVCEKHAPEVLERLPQCTEGNWYVMPSASQCQVGYWPHVSASHGGKEHAIFGCAETNALARMLQFLAPVNEDGSLCPDCAAYEWTITPSHLAANSRDPVCGRSVPSNNAVSQQFEGHLYFFCSLSCRDEFRQAPTRYAKKSLLKEPVLQEGRPAPVEKVT